MMGVCPSLLQIPPHPRDAGAGGALGLLKTSPAQIQIVFISTATFENREQLPHPTNGVAPPTAGVCVWRGHQKLRQGRRGRMAQQAVPRAGSGHAWAGLGGKDGA